MWCMVHGKWVRLTKVSLVFVWNILNKNIKFIGYGGHGYQEEIYYILMI